MEECFDTWVSDGLCDPHRRVIPELWTGAFVPRCIHYHNVKLHSTIHLFLVVKIIGACPLVSESPAHSHHPNCNSVWFLWSLFCCSRIFKSFQVCVNCVGFKEKRTLKSQAVEMTIPLIYKSTKRKKGNKVFGEE